MSPPPDRAVTERTISKLATDYVEVSQADALGPRSHAQNVIDRFSVPQLGCASL